MKVTHLRSVSLVDPEPERLAEFYTQIWGLRRVAGTRSICLSATGPEHHVVAIHPGHQADVAGYSLGLADASAVDAAADMLGERVDTTLVALPGMLDRPGGGYGFSIEDPDGREIELSSDVEPLVENVESTDGPPRPTKVSHLVLNSPNVDTYQELLVDVLGFRIADETEHMVFLKCNLDHHSMALVRAPHASLNHVAFELRTAEDVFAGIEHMASYGFETLWGPGRHGQGKNAFAYFLAPNRQVVEYSAELEQIPDAQLAPKFWRPEDYEVYDEWADQSSLRPSSETRALMLGVPQTPVGRSDAESIKRDQ